MSDHGRERGKNRSRPIESTENCRVIDGAADYNGGALIEVKSIELGGRRADLLVSCRIIEIVFEFCWLHNPNRYRASERNRMAENESAPVSDLNLYVFKYFRAFY